MGNKLYVGNLPFSSTEAELEEMFTQAGQVTSVRLISDRASGRSKGFGFVEMSNDEEAQNAITSFNGVQLGGREIVVNEARPMEKKSFSGPRSSNWEDRPSRGGGQYESRY